MDWHPEGFEWETRDGRTAEGMPRQTQGTWALAGGGRLQCGQRREVAGAGSGKDDGRVS